LYNAKIITSNGVVLNLGFDYGIAFDITPLSGVDVDVSTSQTFQQIGESVDSSSASGLTREIYGFIIENESATTDKELIVYRDSFGSSLVPLLVEGYKKITVVDVRYMTTTLLDSNNLIDYKDGQDVLFLYSTEVLNNSSTLLVM
jgi:hypothetical protein